MRHNLPVTATACTLADGEGMRLFRLQTDGPSLGALDAVALRRQGAVAAC